MPTPQAVERLLPGETSTPLIFDEDEFIGDISSQVFIAMPRLELYY
jgi:hypothetical protein